MVLLGRIPKTQKTEIELVSEISFEKFLTIYKTARYAGEEEFLKEKFFTTDKKMISLFNLCETADPDLVFDAFCCGLIKNIYPSKNLLELLRFHFLEKSRKQ